MARDHYIPAAFLGRFSVQTNLPMRLRHVWVYRKAQATVVEQRAEMVGFRNRYYRLQVQPHVRLVEDAWSKYESQLSDALTKLCDPAVNSTDGQSWVRVLVPFVAGIFARSPDFAVKYEGPVEGISAEYAGISQADNTNLSRLVAMNRSLAPVMAAKWTIFHTVGPEPLVTNDLGYVNNSYISNRSTIGWTIPLGPKCALQLQPCPDGFGRPIMFHAGADGGWRAFIDHVWLVPNNQFGLNAAMSKAAREFLVGPTEDSLRQHVRYMGSQASVTFNPMMHTSHRMQIVHEFEWYRLVRAMRFAPDESRADRFDLHFSDLGEDWSPPLVPIPVNLPEFKSGLSLRGRTITLSMSVVPGFTDYAEGPFPWEQDSQAGAADRDA